MLEDLDSARCNIISDVLGYGGTCRVDGVDICGYICQWLPGYDSDRYCQIISGTGHKLQRTLSTGPVCNDSSVTTVCTHFY